MTRAPLLSAASLVLMLTLAGCSAPATADPKHSPGPTPSSTLVTEILPLGFPELPLFDGPLLHAGHPGNIWSAWIYSTDLTTDLATASAQLVTAGYENTNAGDGWADFHGPDYEVRIIAVVDDTYGSSLAYTIAEKVGN